METRSHVTIGQVRSALRAIYREDPEINLRAAFLRALADDLKPLDERGRWKVDPVWVMAGAAVVALVGIFVFFTIGARG